MNVIIHKKGFTLVEMLVSLVVAGILILSVGVIASVSNNSFIKLNNKQQIYNDIAYGFKLLQYKVRGSTSIAIGNQTDPWISGQHFLVGSDIFGLYQTNQTTTDLIYHNGSKKEIIFSVPQPGIVNLSFPGGISGQSVTVKISGTKNRIPFDLETTIFRRNS